MTEYSNFSIAIVAVERLRDGRIEGKFSSKTMSLHGAGSSRKSTYITILGTAPDIYLGWYLTFLGMLSGYDIFLVYFL